MTFQKWTFYMVSSAHKAPATHKYTTVTKANLKLNIPILKLKLYCL